MLNRLRSRLTYANVVASLALFFALAGGTAVALDGSNTVFNDDIVNDEVTTADVRDDTLAYGGLYSPDLGPASVGPSEVQNSSLAGLDIRDGSLTSLDIGPSTLNSDDVINNSLTGDDIDESSLNLAGISTATFRSNGTPVTLNGDGSFTSISSKTLPAGSWVVIATANLHSVNTCFSCDIHREASCQLRSQGSVIGSTSDRRVILNGQDVKRSLTMNGGAYLPTGGLVALWCNSQNNQNETVTDSQMMLLRVGGFS